MINSFVKLNKNIVGNQIGEFLELGVSGLDVVKDLLDTQKLHSTGQKCESKGGKCGRSSQKTSSPI